MSRTSGKKKASKKDVEKTKKYKVKASKKEKKAKKKHSILKKVILTIFVLVVLLCLIGAGIIAGIFFSDKYKVTKEELEINNFNTTVLDLEGNVIATINGEENRKWVTIEEMPEYLPKLFVALEDERFYSHSGIDIQRTLGATLQFIFKGGSSSYGGSTITQQLIKLTYEDDERSGLAGMERKIREMARAYNTEKVLSKDEILELYLNKIFMGGTYYGVGVAAEYYYSKDVKDLSLAECAYLVAINTAPNAYDPFSTEEEDITKIKNKVKVVLAKFKEEASNLGYELTEEAYQEALTEVENGLAFQKGNVVTNTSSYSYHTAAAINQAIKQLAEEQGLTEQEAKTRIENNGYVIYSTQNSTIQARVEEEFLKSKYVKSGKNKDSDGNLINVHTQAAMVIIDHTTGQVVATVGGLGSDSNSSGLNRATQSTKQPGSSIKTLSCLAPGIEEGTITAATVYDDSITTFGGGYTPHNSSHYSGLITVRTAIAESSNIVNSKILAELGTAKSISYLKNFGITSIVTSSDDSSHNDESIASLALGGLTYGISPLEMAAAYAAIANDGVYIEPTFYTKVEDFNGNTVLESSQESHRVISEQTAYIVKSVLTSVVTSGTGTAANFSNMTVAGKTGSTDNYQNRWFCGFTPYYTAATWYGFDYNEDPTWSGNLACTIWGAVMKDIHSGLKDVGFTKPSNVVAAKICKDSGCLATDSCTNTTTEYFRKSTLPGECEGHTTLTICKETGKIANEYCTDTEEKTYLVKPEKENTSLWSTSDGGKYDIPTEVCDTHKAPEQVEMINVVGKTLTDAKKAIEAIGLDVEIKYSENKNKDDGVVLAQSVNEKEKVEKGTTITLTINKIDETENNVLNNTTTNEIISNNTITNTTNVNDTTTNTTT